MAENLYLYNVPPTSTTLYPDFSHHAIKYYSVAGGQVTKTVTQAAKENVGILY